MKTAKLNRLSEIAALISWIILGMVILSTHATAQATTTKEYIKQEQVYQSNSKPPYITSQQSYDKDYSNKYSHDLTMPPNIDKTSMNPSLQQVTYLNSDNTKTAYNDLLDKREYTRYYNKEMSSPVAIEAFGVNGIKLLDISRGGVGLQHNKALHKGDIIPVKIKYKNITIPATVKILTASNNRAGAQFINLDKPKANKLLYLSIVLEADNHKLVTRFR